MGGPPPAKKGVSDGIVTVTEVECWRQRLKSEAEIMAPVLKKNLEKAGDLLNQKNDVLHYYKAKDAPAPRRYNFTLDVMNSADISDPKTKDDTL